MGTKHKPRDWFRILRDLMAAGISMNKVARACGRTVQAVAHWAEGGEPKDSNARVVLALYRQHCPEKYDAHMKEFEPEVLEYEKKIWVKPDRHIRGRPFPDRVAVSPSSQFDFFVAPEVA